MANSGRRTTQRRGRRTENMYVDGNTVRKLQEVPAKREYRQPEHSVRVKRAKPSTVPRQRTIQQGSRVISREVQRNRAKANSMNRNFAVFLAVMGIMIVLCSINYLRLKTECTSKRSQVASLETQLAELKEDNDAYESQVTSNVDLERIRKIAIGRLGMKYPTDEETETYTTEGGSYVKQYQDVTEK